MNQKDGPDSVPGIKPNLDSSSAFSPEGTDVAAVLEQMAKEAARLDEAKGAAGLAITLAPDSNFSFSTPKEAGEMNHLHRLVALLFACGAQVSEIGFELGLTLEQVDLLSRNLLIEQQIETYKERFTNEDVQAKLQAMMPQALKFVEDVMAGKYPDLNTAEKLSMVKWAIEKVSGKATQQLDVNASVNFGTMLDEMRKMHQARAQIVAGAEHSPTTSSEVIDVTPKKDEMKDWISQWQKGQDAN